MPPRLNKRQQRELQEQLLAYQSTAFKVMTDGEEEEEDVPQPSASGKMTNLFGALNQGMEEDSEDEEQPEEEQQVAAKRKSKKKSKKKKKKASTALESDGDTPSTPAAAAAAVTPVAEEGVVEASSSAAKDPLPKKKKKAPKKDEFEKALEEIAAKYPDLRRPGQTVPASATQTDLRSHSSSALRLRTLLQVSYKDLDPSAELRRFFGSRVISQSSAPQNRRRGPVLRSHLTKPQDNWPHQNTRQGIGMHELDDAEREEKFRRDARRDGGKDGRWWTADHSKAYRGIQHQFMQCVRSHDPENLFALLRVYPWHVDTLLQMSEVARHQGDLSLSSDYTERAIFAFERCFVPAFNLSTGSSRLDFDRIENRPFFLALSRYIQHLQRRGCPRTALEYARLLLELDPAGDPHGASLLLDFLAVKSGMGSWLLELWDIWEDATGCLEMEEGMNVKTLPGWAWARALAMYDAEEAKGDKVHSASTEALRYAILGYPWVVPVLADKAGITLSNELRAHPVLRIETSWSASSADTLHLLSHLYAHRSHPLWKNPPYNAWLSQTAQSCLSQLSDPHLARIYALNYYRNGTPLWISRHVICADIPSLVSFLPPRVTHDIGGMFDPLPPPTSVSGYNEEYFGGVEGYGEGPALSEETLQRMLQRLFRGVGGAPMGEDDAALQEMIMQQIQAEHRGDHQAPAGRQGSEDYEDEEDEEGEGEGEAELDHAEGQHEAPQEGMMATLNDLLARLWRGPLALAEPNTGEAEAEAEADDEYLTDLD